jgi:hypothetical protein
MKVNKKILALSAMLIVALAGIAWADAIGILITHENDGTKLDTTNGEKVEYIASGGVLQHSTGETKFIGKLTLGNKDNYGLAADDAPVGTDSKVAAIKVTPLQQLTLRPAASNTIDGANGVLRFYGGGVISLDNSTAEGGFTYGGSTYLEDGTLIVGITDTSNVPAGLKTITLGKDKTAATLVDRTGLTFDVLKIGAATGGVFAAEGVNSTISALNLAAATAFTVSPDVNKTVTIAAYTASAMPTIRVTSGELIMSPAITSSAKIGFDIERGAKVSLKGANNFVSHVGGEGTLAIDDHIVSVDKVAGNPKFTVAANGNLVFAGSAKLAAPAEISADAGGKITVSGGVSVDIGSGVLLNSPDLELLPRSSVSFDATVKANATGNVVRNVLGSGDLILGGGGTLTTTVKGAPRLRMKDAAKAEFTGDTTLSGINGDAKGTKVKVTGNLTLRGNSLGSAYSGDIDLDNNALFVTRGYQALAGQNTFKALHVENSGRAAALSDTAFGRNTAVRVAASGSLVFPHASYDLGAKGQNLTLSFDEGSCLELEPAAIYASPIEAEAAAATLRVTKLAGAASFVTSPDAVAVRVDLGGLTFSGNGGWLKLIVSENGFPNIGFSGVDAEDGTSFKFSLVNLPPDGYEYKVAGTAVAKNTLYLALSRAKAPDPGDPGEPGEPGEPGDPDDPLPTESVPRPEAITSVAVNGDIVTITYSDGSVKTYDRSKSTIVVTYPMGKFPVTSGGDGLSDSLVFSGKGVLIPAGSKLVFAGTDVGSAITTQALKVGDMIPLNGTVQISGDKTVLSTDVRSLTKGIYYDVSYKSEAGENPVFRGVLAKSYLREGETHTPTPPAPTPPTPKPPTPTPPTPTPPTPKPTPRKGGGGCDAGFGLLGLLALTGSLAAAKVLIAFREEGEEDQED